MARRGTAVKAAFDLVATPIVPRSAVESSHQPSHTLTIANMRRGCVTIQLTDTNPAFLPGLADALTNLGVCYKQVGRRHNALAPAEEAVQLAVLGARRAVLSCCGAFD